MGDLSLLSSSRVLLYLSFFFTDLSVIVSLVQYVTKATQYSTQPIHQVYEFAFLPRGCNMTAGVSYKE